MSTYLKPYGWSRDSAAKMLVAVTVLAACSVPVYSQTGEDAPDPPAGQVPDDGIVTWHFTWDNDGVVDSDNQFSKGWSMQVQGRQMCPLREFTPISRMDVPRSSGSALHQGRFTPNYRSGRVGIWHAIA